MRDNFSLTEVIYVNGVHSKHWNNARWTHRDGNMMMSYRKQ